MLETNPLRLHGYTIVYQGGDMVCVEVGGGGGKGREGGRWGLGEWDGGMGGRPV
jgi:hypothetical protein